MGENWTWILWTVFGVVLVIAEVFTPGFVLLWFGVGALAAALAAVVGAGLAVQFILFIAVFVTISLTLVAANGMAMSMRERTTEIAVLKAIGFQNGTVLMLMLGEAILIALVGGAIGVAAGRGLYALAHQFAPMFIQISNMPWQVMAWGMAVAAGIGLASGLVPATLASRLSVIDGLRRIV